eukprot:414296-Alexandrium_andersonii.AAC.1
MAGVVLAGGPSAPGVKVSPMRSTIMACICASPCWRISSILRLVCGATFCLLYTSPSPRD